MGELGGAGVKMVEFGDLCPFRVGSRSKANQNKCTFTDVKMTLGCLILPSPLVVFY